MARIHVSRNKRACPAAAGLLLLACGLGAAGCPGRKPAKNPLSITGKQVAPKPPAPAPGPVQADEGDYFPLWIPASWTYRTQECFTRVPQENESIVKTPMNAPDEVCTRSEIGTKLEKKITVDGKEVFLLLECTDPEPGPDGQAPPDAKPVCQAGTKGFMSDGDFVYLVFLDNGHIAKERSIAGKHNLKPGDSWDKQFLADTNSATHLTCGEPGFLNLPSDDSSPGLYKTICCTNKDNPDYKPEDYYAVCYTEGLGRVAEYAPNILSEILSYSIRPSGTARPQ